MKLKKSLEPLDSEYSFAEMREALMKEVSRKEVMKILQREEEMRVTGIPDQEI